MADRHKAALRTLRYAYARVSDGRALHISHHQKGSSACSIFVDLGCGKHGCMDAGSRTWRTHAFIYVFFPLSYLHRLHTTITDAAEYLLPLAVIILPRLSFMVLFGSK